MTSTWSPSAKCLHNSPTLSSPHFFIQWHSSSSIVRNLLHHSTSPEVRYLHHCSDNSVEHFWPPSNKLLLNSSNNFFITLCLPLKNVSVNVPKLFHHTWFQLTNYSDTVATLSSPRLSTSDEWLHLCSDTFFTPLSPSQFRHFFPTLGMLVANIYIKNLVL
jgi:hypothetical protein